MMPFPSQQERKKEVTEMAESAKKAGKKGEGAGKEVKKAEETQGLSPFEEMDRMVEGFFSRG